MSDHTSRWDARDAVIVIRSDGSWHASDGCNRVASEYEVHGFQWSSSMRGFSGGVGCPYGTVNYLQILNAPDGLTVKRQAERLTFHDDGGLALELRAYDGHPAPYRDVSLDDLVGSWRPIELDGDPVRRLNGYGYLGIGDGEVSTVRGCQQVHGPLQLDYRGGFFVRLRTRPVGCPVTVGPGDLGPNSASVLRRAVRVQVHGDLLEFFGPSRKRIGVYRANNRR